MRHTVGDGEDRPALPHGCEQRGAETWPLCTCVEEIEWASVWHGSNPRIERSVVAVVDRSVGQDGRVERMGGLCRQKSVSIIRPSSRGVNQPREMRTGMSSLLRRVSQSSVRQFAQLIGGAQRVEGD